MIVAFIDDHRHRWGVEPIRAVLTNEMDIEIVPGTYYAHKKRPSSPRSKRDASLKEQIIRIHADKRMRVYGIRRIHAQLNRDGTRGGPLHDRTVV